MDRNNRFLLAEKQRLEEEIQRLQSLIEEQQREISDMALLADAYKRERDSARSLIDEHNRAMDAECENSKERDCENAREVGSMCEYCPRLRRIFDDRVSVELDSRVEEHNKRCERICSDARDFLGEFECTADESDMPCFACPCQYKIEG